MKRYVPHSLAIVIASIVPAFTVVWTVDPLTPVIVGLAIGAVLFAWNVSFTVSWRALGLILASAFFISLTSLLYAKPMGVVYFEWGFVSITDGSFGVALASFLRIVVIALPTALVLRSIVPHELIATTAVRRVVPGRVALATLIALRLVPVITSDLAETRTARRAAGSTVPFRSLVVTMFVIAIRRAIRMSEIAEVRGFSKPDRVWLSYRPFSLRDWLLVATAVSCGALSLVMTGTLGLWNSVI